MLELLTRSAISEGVDVLVTITIPCPYITSPTFKLALIKSPSPLSVKVPIFGSNIDSVPGFMYSPNRFEGIEKVAICSPDPVGKNLLA